MFNPYELLCAKLDLIQKEVGEIKDSLAATSKSEQKFYTVSDAAKKLGVAEITIYRNVQNGTIPFKKIGGTRIMIPGSYFEK